MTKAHGRLSVIFCALLATVFASPLIAGELRQQCYDGIDNDGDGYIDGADTDCGGTGGASSPKDLRSFLTDLQAQIDALEARNTALEAEVAFLNGEVQALQAGGSGGDSNPVLNYMNLVEIDGVPNIVFAGVNVRLQSNGQIGRGNMFIGSAGTGDGQHNLVVGKGNIFDSDYSMIVGHDNQLDSMSDYATALGSWHWIRGEGSVAAGGRNNDVHSGESFIGGGAGNSTYTYGFQGILGGSSRTSQKLYGILADG